MDLTRFHKEELLRQLLDARKELLMVKRELGTEIRGDRECVLEVKSEVLKNTIDFIEEAIVNDGIKTKVVASVESSVENTSIRAVIKSDDESYSKSIKQTIELYLIEYLNK